MRSGKFWLIVLALVGGWWVWRHRAAPPLPTAADRALLLNRIWVDKMPQNDRDKFNVFVALERGRLGVFQCTSNWEGAYAVFQWRFEGRDSRLRLRFPQTGKTHNLLWDARRCNQRGFEFCLTMRGSPRGPARWYSRKGWEIRTQEELEARVKELAGLMDEQ